MTRISAILSALLLTTTPAHPDEFKLQSKTYRVGPFPTSIIAVDLSGNTLPEIVTSNRGHLSDPSEEIPAGNHLSYLTADNALEYKALPQLRTGFGPYAIEVANIDALRAKDLVVANFMATRNRDITLLRNLGENLFEPIDFLVPDEGLHYKRHLDGADKPLFPTPGFTALAIDDFDGDGYRDIVATGWSSDILAYFPGTIEGYFDTPIISSVPGGPRDVVIHDFNKDGKQDLAILAYSTHELVMLQGIGKGLFEEVNRFVTRGKLPISISLGDLNSDGKQDLVVGHSHADDSVVIFYQDNPFQFSISQVLSIADDRKKIEFGIRDVHLMDANQDGLLDIALACSTAQQVVVLVNRDTKKSFTRTFKHEKYSFKKGRPYAITSADFNLDGEQDLGVALWDENRVALLLHK